MRGILLAAVAICGVFTATPARALELKAIVLQKCPLSEPPTPEMGPVAAIGVAMAANLAGHVVTALASGVVAHLKEARSFSRTSIFPMGGVYQGYAVAGSTGLFFANHTECLVIALADRFSVPTTGDIDADVMKSAYPALTAHGGNFPVLYNVVGLRSDPVFYAEFQIVGDAREATAFKLVPSLIHHPKWAEKGAVQRDVSLLLEWSLPGQASPYAATQVVRVNTTPQPFDKERISDWGSPWMPLPSMPDLQAEIIRTGARYRPANLKVMFIETAKPNKLAQIFAKTLEDSKADMERLSRDTVKQALDSAARAEAQAARAATYSAASKKYTDSYLTLVDLKSKFDNEKSAEVKESIRAQFAAQMLVVKADGEVAKQAAKSIGEQGAFMPLPLPSLP